MYAPPQAPVYYNQPPPVPQTIIIKEKPKATITNLSTYGDIAFCSACN